MVVILIDRLNPKREVALVCVDNLVVITNSSNANRIQR